MRLWITEKSNSTRNFVLIIFLFLINFRRMTVTAFYWSWASLGDGTSSDLVDTNYDNEDTNLREEYANLRPSTSHHQEGGDLKSSDRKPSTSKIFQRSVADQPVISDESQRYNAKLNQACKAHRQCDLNSFCDFHYGICKPYRSHGQMCRSDDQCATYLQCTFGRCASVPKLGHNGARCKDDGDCLPSFCCARQHGQKVCKPKLKLGQNCFVSEGGLSEWLNSMCPCDEGLICGFSGSNGKSSLLNGQDDLWAERNAVKCIAIEQ